MRKQSIRNCALGLAAGVLFGVLVGATEPPTPTETYLVCMEPAVRDVHIPIDTFADISLRCKLKAGL